ncbi:MAG: DUF1998 domain-containing protein, partial [Chloroflexi bacterium]|nr:DUF1998 domain-containing protein [Chloroflexota bacterium]
QTADGRRQTTDGGQRSTVSGQRSAVGGQRSPDKRTHNPQLATRNSPRIYIFERIAAGLGFSEQVFERHGELLAGADDLIRGCGCRYGCPSCVGPVLLNDAGERPLLETKALALALLEVLRTGRVGPAGEGKQNREILFR